MMSNEEYSQDGDAITNIREQLGILDGDSPRPGGSDGDEEMDRPDGERRSKIPTPDSHNGIGGNLKDIFGGGVKIVALVETIKNTVPKARIKGAEETEYGTQPPSITIDMYIVKKDWVPDVWYDIVAVKSALQYASQRNPGNALFLSILQGDVKNPVSITNKEKLGKLDTLVQETGVIGEKVVDRDLYVYSVKVLGTDIRGRMPKNQRGGVEGIIF